MPGPDITIHTPGPWSIGHTKRFKNAAVIHQANEPYNEIAIVRNGDMTREQGNAKLLAQAPNMLKALQQCVAEHGQTVEQAIDGVPLDQWEQQFRAVLRALYAV